MNYADRIGVPYVAFLGEDEVANGVVSLKDMVSGEQEKVALEAAPGELEKLQKEAKKERGLCAIFQARADSRPPEPRRRRFMGRCLGWVIWLQEINLLNYCRNFFCVNA